MLLQASSHSWLAVLAVIPLAAGLSLAGSIPAAKSTVTPVKIGAPVGVLSFQDVTGKSYSVSNPHDRSAVLLLFLSTRCPISKSYAPRLRELDKAYAAQGVAVFGVNSN